MTNPNEAILLTEDGNPIGDLAIADGEGLQRDSQTMALEAARADVLADSAAELTGDPFADPEFAELYPEYANAELKKKAMFMYVAQNKSIDDISAALDVPGRTVSAWAYSGHWDEALRREISVIGSKARLDLERLRASRRISIVREQLDQAKMIRDKASNNIRQNNGSLKSNSEAWSAAAKIEHTLTGVAEGGMISAPEDSQEGKAQQSKPSLVVVFPNGGLPPVKRSNQ